jgi:cellulose synthase/poly-beta-1,6-N-acetylglucosamine synthase-like glycosyltransferase
MLLDLLVVLSLVYLAQMVLFAIGVWRSRYPADRTRRPSVSIIIAARDEEDNIGRCLESMCNLTYPHEKLEVLVIDDRSTDRTAEVVSGYLGRPTTIRLIRARPSTGHLQGKANAVTQGLDVATGEVILFTDADCEVQPGWVEETVKYYNESRVGLVAGFTELKARGLFEKMQALDWFLLFSLAAAGIRLRHPFTAVGNNLSVTRAAYDAVGGYRSIPFSVTEDYALFHAVTSKGKFLPRFPLDPKTLVFSRPCTSWKQLYNQKKRWFAGGQDMEVSNFVFFGLSYLFKLLLFVGIPAMWAAGNWVPWLASAAGDFVVLVPALTAFRRWNLLSAFLFLEIYLAAYVVLFPPLVIAGSAVVWKDRSFRRHAH